MNRLGWVIAWGWLLGVGFGASQAADANGFLVTGSRSALWVVRRRGEQYDIVAKPISKEWTWQARSMQGRPLRVVATDRRLVTIFPQRSVLIHSLDTDAPLTGTSPADPNWPKDAQPAALCDTDGIAGQSGSVVAVVRLADEVEKATGRAKTAVDDMARSVDDDGEIDQRAIDAMAGAMVDRAAGERLAPAAMRETRLGVFLYTGSEWKLLTSLPCARWQRGGKVFAASTGGKLYLWLAGCELAGEAAAVVSYDGRDWRIELTPEQVGRVDPTAMIALKGHVALLGREALRSDSTPATQPTTAPAPTTRPTTAPTADDDGLMMLTIDIHTGARIRQTITPADGVEMPTSATLTGVARLGDRIMLAWESPASPNAPLLLGSVGLDGQIARTEPLTILTEPEPSGDAAMVIEIMMGAVLVAMFIPLFILRPRGPQKPFALPKLYRPGNLLKRAIAGAIDLMPFMAVASAALGVEPASMDDLRAMTNIADHPVEYAYWLVSMLGCYVVYGVVMEYRFGATVGKLITRLRVVGNGGETPDLRACFLRNIVKIVELTTFLVALLIVLPIVTPYRQRLGDMLARTSVVEKDSIELAEADRSFDVPEEMKADDSGDGDGCDES